MKIFEKSRLFLFMLSAAVLSVFPTGCMKDEIEDLRQRVESLESVVETLQEMMDNGAMIKGITPLEDGSGWLIEFTGESVAPIEIRNGGAGVTPMIDIRPCEDGGYSLWYNITPGYPEDGWVDTGTDLTGPAGEDGDAGVTPRIKVEENSEGELTVWYNVTPGYPEDGWIDTGVDLRAPGEESLLSGIVRNADGTVTFIMNDGLGTEYTFAMYSTVSHIEIMVSDTVAVSYGQDAKIVFRVNPSSAWVPTGSGEAISQWALDEFGTKSGYVNASEVFVLESVLPDGDRTGQYVATVSCNVSAHDASVRAYEMALVLNNNASDPEADDALVSSGLFLMSVVEDDGLVFSHAGGELFQDGSFYGDDKSNFILNFHSFDPDGTWDGWYLHLNVVAPKADYGAQWLELSPGTYVFSTSNEVYTVDYFYDTSLILYENGSPTVNIVKDAEVQFVDGGTMTVAGDADNGYDVTFNILLSDGSSFEAKYSGRLGIDNPFIVSTFTEDRDAGEIPITMLNYFENPYPTFASDIFMIQGYSSSIYVENQMYAGSGHILATQISVPLGSGSILPDGEYVIDDNLNAGYALAGYLDPAGQRAGTWLMYMEDGELAGMAPIISGTVTSRYADGLYSIKIEGTDDAGNAISGTLVGAAPAGDAAVAAPGSLPGVL